MAGPGAPPIGLAVGSGSADCQGNVAEPLRASPQPPPSQIGRDLPQRDSVDARHPAASANATARAAPDLHRRSPRRVVLSRGDSGARLIPQVPVSCPANALANSRRKSPPYMLRGRAAPRGTVAASRLA